MKYYLIAGEASGDLHGGNLIRHLHQLDPSAQCRVWGGDLMEEAGATLVKHYRDLAFMGFVEVIRNLPTILGNLRFCKQDILSFQPDALILIDYPGFNLRIAKWAKKQGIRVFYFISPQVWAWHTSRVHGIKASVDHLFVILPFEKEFYARYDYDVTFVGHPLLDIIGDFTPNPHFAAQNQLDKRPIVALLPGSRRQEIARMLPAMVEVAQRFPDKQFVVAGAPAIPAAFYRPMLDAAPNVRFVTGQTYQLLHHAAAAIVTSGTATLETALFGVPEVIGYAGNPVSFWIARRLVEVKYISLVNLIVDRPLIQELIQQEYTVANLQQAVNRLFTAEERTRLTQGFAELRQMLGEGQAARQVAQHVVQTLQNG